MPTDTARKKDFTPKELPYFKWYPSDAQTDFDYCAMSYEERGFYLSCLDLAWINGGLPTDMKELARAMHLKPGRLTRLWARVGKKFELYGDKLINPRQERERSIAVEKSKRAVESIKARYDRSTNELPRAFESVSVLAFNSKKELPYSNGKVSSAGSFQVFWERWCELTHRRQRQGDSCQAWLSVVTQPQEAAVMACLERYGASDEVGRGVVCNPDKWLYEQARDQWRGEWPAPKSAIELRSQALQRAMGDD